MVRTTPALLTGAFVVCAAVGCAHFVETQAIKHFTAALEKSDLNAVKETASDHFDKALRRDDALDTFKVLKLHPEEKITVVKVEDVGADEKKVVVTVGKSKRKMQYKLVHNTTTGKWLVDDVVIKQNKGDVTASKSVSEQMDLLLVVQDFMQAWQTGKGPAVQAVTTQAFAKLLGDLPPSHLERITKRIAGDKLKRDEFRPEAQIDGNDAVVRLQRPKGVLILTMRQTTKGWKVADAAVESRKDKDHIASAMKMALVVRTVVDFLRAYDANDQPGLEKVAAPRFFDECLKVADLKSIALPKPTVLGDKDLVKTHDLGGDYIIQRKSDTVKISLVRLKKETDDPSSNAFLVEDVTIYDAKEEKRISALFLAQARLQLFMRAVIKGNATLVRENSTEDLKTRIWTRLGPVVIADVLPPEIELEPPVIVGSDFHGSVIRIHVHQGSRDLTYLMRDWSGTVNVDDVLMPVLDRPSSMKENMQALLPIRLMEAAFRQASLEPERHERQLDLLNRVSSADFHRLIWGQVQQVPESAFIALPHFDAPITSIKDTPAGQTVTLGDERLGSRFELVKEKDVWVIDRMWMVGGPQAEPVELKRMLLNQLAKRGPKGLAADPSANPIDTDAATVTEPAAASEAVSTKGTVTNAAGTSTAATAAGGAGATENRAARTASTSTAAKTAAALAAEPNPFDTNADAAAVDSKPESDSKPATTKSGTTLPSSGLSPRRSSSAR